MTRLKSFLEIEDMAFHDSSPFNIHNTSPPNSRTFKRASAGIELTSFKDQPARVSMDF
jgi:hypothetical protein